MTRGLRHAGLVAFLAALALDSLSVRRPPPGDQDDAPYVAISSLLGRVPNIDPLVDPHPFFLMRPWEVKEPRTGTVVQRGGERSLDLPLDIQAMNFSGTIFLRALSQGSRNSPFTFTVIPNQISVGPTEATNPAPAVARFAESVLSSGDGQASMRIPTASAVLRVSTSSSSPSAADAGSFLAVVEARQDSSIYSPLLGSGYVVVSLVVMSDDRPIADCPNVVSSSWKQGDAPPPGYQMPDILPLQQFLRSLFILKRASPEKVSFSGGVNAPVSGTGWEMLIEKPPVSTSSPSISPTESLVRLVNPTRNLRSLVAVGDRCSITGNIVLNPGDPPQEIRISNTNTTSIVLAGDGQALGRFSAPNFWTLFGGRRVTLTALN